jgi:protein-S-isoprenylcysteine O-methyltransferase Ste14
MGRGRTTEKLLHRGVIWVLAQTGLMGAVLVCGAWWHNQWNSLVLAGLGFALLGGSALCGLWGALSLRGSLSPFPRPHQGTRLVQSGIYAFMRHPLYTSVMAAAAGWALIRQSWPALAAALALAVFLDQKARREEQWLSELFQEYPAYQRRTRKFIPWLY